MTIYSKAIACAVLGFAIGSFALTYNDNAKGTGKLTTAAALDTVTCGPRDRQDRCSFGAIWGYRAGDVFVVEDMF